MNGDTSLIDEISNKEEDPNIKNNLPKLEEIKDKLNIPTGPITRAQAKKIIEMTQNMLSHIKEAQVLMNEEMDLKVINTLHFQIGD